MTIKRGESLGGTVRDSDYLFCNYCDESHAINPWLTEVPKSWRTVTRSDQEDTHICGDCINRALVHVLTDLAIEKAKAKI